jgi:hypothetical protein
LLIVDGETEIRCAAIWGYDAQSSNDLSFAQDDIIITYPLKSGAEPDWGYGQSELTGLKGFFPANYVEPVKDNGGKICTCHGIQASTTLVNELFLMRLIRQTEHQGTSTLGL